MKRGKSKTFYEERVFDFINMECVFECFIY